MERFFFSPEIYFPSPDSRPVLFAPIPSRHLGRRKEGRPRRRRMRRRAGPGRDAIRAKGGAHNLSLSTRAPLPNIIFCVTLTRVEMIVQGAFAKGLFSFAYERRINKNKLVILGYIIVWKKKNLRFAAFIIPFPPT